MVDAEECVGSFHAGKEVSARQEQVLAWKGGRPAHRVRGRRRRVSRVGKDPPGEEKLGALSAVGSEENRTDGKIQSARLWIQ